MFQALEHTSQLSEGYSRCFKISGKKLLLIHSDGVTRLIPVACPHAGHSLKKASLNKGEIVCPKHGIRFCLNTGLPQGGEALSNVAPLQLVDLFEQDGFIGVMAD